MAAAMPRHKPGSFPKFDMGCAVKVVRQGLGMSQLQLSEKMNVPRAYVSKIENGHAIPIIISVKRFADAFGMPVSGLFQIAEGCCRGV